jgi:deazaflavin-dependent oxidoreductase (nitroreductase family)
MSQQPYIPPDMREYNRKLIGEFRANGGKLSGQMAGARLMLLTTRGARSGRPHTVVIGYRPSGDKYVVIASNNGAKTHPDWYRNLLADPHATVEVGDKKLDVLARTTAGDERERMGALVDYLPRQQQLTPREIPVVVVEAIP